MVMMPECRSKRPRPVQIARIDRKCMKLTGCVLRSECSAATSGRLCLVFVVPSIRLNRRRIMTFVQSPPAGVLCLVVGQVSRVGDFFLGMAGSVVKVVDLFDDVVCRLLLRSDVSSAR